MDSVITNSEAWVSSTQLPITLVMVIGAVIGAVISSYATYHFTRRMRLEAEWRKDKLKYYGQLLDSITETMSMPENYKKVSKQFARASNAVALIAPQEVADILFEFYYSQESDFEQMESHEEENWVSNQKRLLRQLVLAMRKDLRIKPSDDPDTFRYRLRSPLHVD